MRKSRDSLKKCLGFLLILGFISLGVIGGCNNGNGNGNLGVTSAARIITFINNCSETIWVGSQNLGTTESGWELIAMELGCKFDADCQTGLTKTATCNTKTQNCEQVVSVPSPCTSCQAWAMTGCDFNSEGLCDFEGSSIFNCCATGGCTVLGGDSGLQCASGAQAPFTVVEFCLGCPAAAPGNDFYDVSIIDGMNVSAEITPVGSTAALPTNFDPDYWCGNPGGGREYDQS